MTLRRTLSSAVALFALVASLAACTSTDTDSPSGTDGSQNPSSAQSQSADVPDPAGRSANATALQQAAEAAMNTTFAACDHNDSNTNFDGEVLVVSEVLCRDLQPPLKGSEIGFAVLPIDAKNGSVVALHEVVKPSFPVLILGANWVIVLDHYAGDSAPDSDGARAQLAFFQTLATKLDGTLVHP